MGRGLSEQQRQVLAFGVAANAYQNGGVPTPAVFLQEAWTVAGRWRMALADALPDMRRDAVLYAVGGMRPLQKPVVVRRRGHVRVLRWHDFAGVDRSTTVAVCDNEYVDPWFRWKPDHRNRSRQVSIGRATDALAKRGLLAWTCGPAPWACCVGNDARGWTGWRWNLQTDGPCGLSDDVAAFWDRQRPVGWYVTAEGFDTVGHAWHSIPTATVARALDVVRMRGNQPAAVYAERAAEYAATHGTG